MPLQTADLYATRVHLHARIPRGLARLATSPDHSYPHRARLTPPLTRLYQAPAHPPDAHHPTCKGPVHPLPLSPGHPHGQVRLHSRRGPRHAGEEGAAHTHGQPATSQGGDRAQGETGGAADAPSLPARPATFVRSPPGDPRPMRPAGRPPSGPLQTGQPRRPRKPSAAPLGASSAGPVGRVPQEPMAARVRATRGSRTVRERQADGTAALLSRRRRLFPGPAECRRGAPAHRARRRGGRGGESEAEITLPALKEPPSQTPGGGSNPGFPADRKPVRSRLPSLHPTPNPTHQ